MKRDRQEFTAWINWAALQRTRLLINLTEPLSLRGISLALYFLHLFLSLQPLLPSKISYPRNTRTHKDTYRHTHSARTHLWLKAASRELKSQCCWGSPLSCCEIITKNLFKPSHPRLPIHTHARTHPHRLTHTATGAKEMLDWRVCGCKRYELSDVLHKPVERCQRGCSHIQIEEQEPFARYGWDQYNRRRYKTLFSRRQILISWLFTG